MSRRSKRQRRQLEAQTARHKAEEQQALRQVATDARTSIAGIVLQRMTNSGLIHVPLVPPAEPAKANGLAGPAIKQQPDSEHTLPTVEAPATLTPAPTTIPAVPVYDKPWPDHWPKAPATVMKPTEWRMALENKDYYELKAVEWEIAHPGETLPWFAFPKYGYQYSEFVYVTEAMADALLARNFKNRPQDDKHIDGCARDIGHDRWFQTHESIAINTELNMEDGQHRAKAIKKAKKAWPFYITWNVPPESIAVIDSGKKRPVNQKLSFVIDSRLGTKTASLCRAMMMGLTGRNQRYTEMEIAEFAYKHIDAINWVATNFSRCKHGTIRADLQAVIAKGYLWWGEDVVGPFVKRYVNVNWTGEGDPVKALYLWVTTAKNEGRSNSLLCYKKTLTALVAHAESRPLNKLYTREEDIFEWLPGWDIPDRGTAKSRPATEVEHED